jgi:hypothetical protein
LAERIVPKKPNPRRQCLGQEGGVGIDQMEAKWVQINSPPGLSTSIPRANSPPLQPPWAIFTDQDDAFSIRWYGCPVLNVGLVSIEIAITRDFCPSKRCSISSAVPSDGEKSRL